MSESLSEPRDYREQLSNALEEDWFSLMLAGDYWEFEDGTRLTTVDARQVSKGRWETHWEAVTCTEDGKHYRWEYSQGATENQDSIGPAEYGKPELTEVVGEVVITTSVTWVPVQ